MQFISLVQLPPILQLCPLLHHTAEVMWLFGKGRQEQSVLPCCCATSSEFPPLHAARGSVPRIAFRGLAAKEGLELDTYITLDIGKLVLDLLKCVVSAVLAMLEKNKL